MMPPKLDDSIHRFLSNQDRNPRPTSLDDLGQKRSRHSFHRHLHKAEVAAKDSSTQILWVCILQHRRLVSLSQL